MHWGIGPWRTIMNLFFNYTTIKYIDRSYFPEIVWLWCLKTWTIQYHGKKSAKINWALAKRCIGWENRRLSSLISKAVETITSQHPAIMYPTVSCRAHLHQGCAHFYFWLWILCVNKKLIFFTRKQMVQIKSSCRFKTAEDPILKTLRGHISLQWVDIDVSNY